MSTAPGTHEDREMDKLARDFSEFVKASQETQRIQNNLIDRITAVLAGDKQFGLQGLVQQVKEHDDIIRGFAASQQQLKGSVKTILYIGGGIITAVQIAIQVLSFWSGNGAH